MSQLTKTERTKAGRKADRMEYDRAAIDAVLDECLIAHVGFVENGAPMVLPTCAWRMDDRLYMHFAANGRFAGTLRSGAELCVTVSVLDGLVLARSAMHHSVNYRSVMLFGRAEEIDDAEEKSRVLAGLVDKVRAGRSALVRTPDAKELAVTAVFSMPIAEGSLKARSGPPVERPDDLALPIWGGVIPVSQVMGDPVADDHVTDGVSPP